MKKVLACLLCVTIALGVVGCRTNKNIEKQYEPIEIDGISIELKMELYQIKV